MRSINRVFMAAVILLAAAGIYAQGSGAAAGEREVQEQFSALQSKSWEIRRNTAYREKSETVFVDDKASKEAKQTMVSEFAPPDRRRYYTTVEIDGKISNSETILIGDQIFWRVNGGKWEVKKTETRGGTGVGSANTRLIEKTTLDGRPVTVYEESWSHYFDGKSESGITRYWFTDDGYLLKQVVKTKAEGDKPASTKTSLYEYDPNIKIEAPVVK